MKRILMILLVTWAIGISFAETQTFKPYGYVELAYVPKRMFFEQYENEIMGKLGLGLKVSLKKFDFVVNWEQTTYANKSRSIFFRPNTQAYDVSVELRRSFGSRNLSLFFSHECVHPVDKDRFWLYNFERKKSF